MISARQQHAREDDTKKMTGTGYIRSGECLLRVHTRVEMAAHMLG